jgi:quinol monooxygenase YgiN
MYTAFVTADNEETFLDEFRNVVLFALEQYEDNFCTIGQERKDCIKEELAALVPVPLNELCKLSYDLKTDGGGCKGVIAVEEVFTNREEVQSRFQPWVDKVNEDCAEDEKWAVFDGGFFPSTQGFEIDELFK